MVERVQGYMKTAEFQGEIEIDESLFGRKMKHNRGEPRGTQIWIFGMIERATGRILLYPVDDRSKSTLLPIIRRHVRPGSTIYSDGWSAYLQLNEEGFRHFVVNHKSAFQQQYKNIITGEILTVHTNTIEGCWAQCKRHFKRMNGVRGLNNFETYLCEVIYRHLRDPMNIYERFMSDMRSDYGLVGPRHYQYTLPIFQTTERANYNETQIIADESDVQDSACSPSTLPVMQIPLEVDTYNEEIPPRDSTDLPPVLSPAQPLQMLTSPNLQYGDGDDTNGPPTLSPQRKATSTMTYNEAVDKGMVEVSPSRKTANTDAYQPEAQEMNFNILDDSFAMLFSSPQDSVQGRQRASVSSPPKRNQLKVFHTPLARSTPISMKATAPKQKRRIHRKKEPQLIEDVTQKRHQRKFNRRVLKCPKEWKPVSPKKNNFHVHCEFRNDDDDDFLYVFPK